MSGEICRYLRVIDSKMVASFDGPMPEGNDIVRVPANWPYFLPGLNVRNFGEDWALRPLADRIADGLVVVGKAEKIVGEEVVAKDVYERVRDGLDKAPPGMKLATAEDGVMSWEPIPTAERVTAGEITRETGVTIEALHIRGEREEYYRVADGAIAKLEREIRAAEVAGTDVAALEAMLAKWDAYAQAWADVPQQASFPWKYVKPTRPDGVCE